MYEQHTWSSSIKLFEAIYDQMRTIILENYSIYAKKLWFNEKTFYGIGLGSNWKPIMVKSNKLVIDLSFHWKACRPNTKQLFNKILFGQCYPDLP